ncbi:MAG TPA: hypothetical protein VH250_13540 [Granulicella sp.]|jgi:hypothetical protein|nr:hypothetical protein [Granulicella sp.]
MKVGEPIHAELLYPVYEHDHLVLPAKTLVTGTVISLAPDHTRRLHARLRGDFTPFHTPVVRFTSIVLANGTTVPIVTGTATDGAPIYRLVAPPPQKGGLIARQFAVAKQAAKDRLAVVTGPDKLDRLKQFLYTQLPVHPERIAKATAWTVETTEPAPLAALPLAATAPHTPPATPPPPAPKSGEPPTWILQAYLKTGMSSATSKAGESIEATVAEPIRNPNGSIAVPQGSILTGTITEAQPARSFARAGKLRFNFRQIQLPGEQAQNVQATLTGADSASDQQLAMTSEGQVQPKPQDKILVPALLIALASRPFDEDDQLTHSAEASNSIGLVGFIVGTAAGHPNIAAGIGFYGAAISIYERLLRHGKEVAFARDTRIVLQTTARHSAALMPDHPAPRQR